MQTILHRPSRVLQIAAAMFPLIAMPAAAHADIFQWEYIDPADPSHGKQQSTTLAPGGAGVDAAPGAGLAGRNLTMAYLIGADLTGAVGRASNLTNADLSQANLTNSDFDAATLTDADFTGAEVRGADFSINEGYGTGITLDQLYSTASYQGHDLSGIRLVANDLAGGNFAASNLTDANLVYTTLTDADFREANLTNASLFRATLTGADLSEANLTDADFGGARLTDVDFTGAEVRGANLSRGCGFLCFGTGINLAQLVSTASYQAHDLRGVKLVSSDLSGWNFASQNLANANFGSAKMTGADFREANLTNTDFYYATLTGADFTGAEVRGASFYGSGFTLAQLYSTASYQAHNLTGVALNGDLNGWDFAGQNLTNASFSGATLTDADFTAADARGAVLFDFQLSGATTANLIRPDGHINGLDLDGGGFLAVRDYDGGGTFLFGLGPGPIPITVDQHLSMGPGGTLRMVFEPDAWDSTIFFAPGIPVTLGGTLELTFADDVNLASQVGRTFNLFDWTGVNPTGAFAISSPYAWNLSNLYTTGEATLTAIPEPSTLALIIVSLATCWCARMSRVRKPA